MTLKVSGSNAIAFGFAFTILSVAVGYYAHGLAYHFEAGSYGIWMVLYPSILIANYVGELSGQSIQEQLFFVFVVQFIAGVVAYEVVAHMVNLFRKSRP